jgi:hypothetical protein
MGLPLPDIEKFMPLWVCFGLVLGGIVAITAVLIVLSTSSRRTNHDSN